MRERLDVRIWVNVPKENVDLVSNKQSPRCLFRLFKRASKLLTQMAYWEAVEVARRKIELRDCLEEQLIVNHSLS